MRAYIDAHPDTLPIILSLEMHCSHSFQEMCAKILSDTLKDRLYIHEPSGPLPTPLDLRGKAVIKGKRPPEAEDDETALQSMNSVRSEEEEFETALVDGISSKIGGSISMSKSSDSGVFDSVKGKLKSTMRAKNSDGPPLPKTHPDLARLTLFNGAKFKDLRMSASLPLEDMHSFSGEYLKMRHVFLDECNAHPIHSSIHPKRARYSRYSTETQPQTSRCGGSTTEST